MYFLLCFWQFPLNLVEPEVFHVGDKVNILDPYNGVIARNIRIQLLSMIHRVPLGPKDTNVNVIHVTSNILLAYEHKIDGCECLKETEISFIW